MSIFGTILNTIFSHEHHGNAKPSAPWTTIPALPPAATADGTAQHNLAHHRTVMGRPTGNGGLAPDSLRT